MKKSKIILLILGIIAAIVLGLLIIARQATKTVLETMDEARSQADERTVGLIITGVQHAYTTALMNNAGNNPTLQQVKSNFSCEGATWTDDYVIEADNFNCDVKVENNNLVLKCLDKEKNMNMELSN